MKTTEVEIKEEEFKIGNTTLNSHFPITVPDYGVPIPECHSTGPIINPCWMSLADIVNMIERGLHVQFERENDPERIYIFLREYNKLAREYNANLGENVNPVAENAENYFLLKLNYKIAKDKTIQEVTDPNPFKKQMIHVRTPEPKQNVYKNEAIANKFKLKGTKVPKKQTPAEKMASEYRMFEMFSQPNVIAPDGSIIYDPNMVEDNRPSVYDDLELGD